MSGRRLLTATTLVALAMSLTTPAGATVDLGGCRSIIHHGMNPSWGEETIYSAEQATRWGFGGEVDARITADKRLGSGHDLNARRVSGGTETRRWSDMTLAEAKAVNLVKGGHPASTAEMVLAAARTTGGRLMITVNGYAEFGEDWRVWGFDALWSVVTNNAMEGRVIVGGFGVIPYLHEHFPDMRTFERQEFDEVRTPEYFIDRGIDLVGVPVHAVRPGVRRRAPRRRAGRRFPNDHHQGPVESRPTTPGYAAVPGRLERRHRRLARRHRHLVPGQRDDDAREPSRSDSLLDSDPSSFTTPTSDRLRIPCGDRCSCAGGSPRCRRTRFPDRICCPGMHPFRFLTQCAPVGRRWRAVLGPFCSSAAVGQPSKSSALGLVRRPQVGRPVLSRRPVPRRPGRLGRQAGGPDPLTWPCPSARAGGRTERSPSSSSNEGRPRCTASTRARDTPSERAMLLGPGGPSSIASSVGTVVWPYGW